MKSKRFLRRILVRFVYEFNYACKNANMIVNHP